MHQKKSRSSAAKRLLLGRLDVDEVPLTERQPGCSSWSEDGLVDVSSTTGLSHNARGDRVGKKTTEQQDRERSGCSRSLLSSDIANMEEGGAHTFSSTRPLSQVPRLHKGFPLSFVHLWIIIVAVAMVTAVTVVHKFRGKKGGVEVGDHHRYSGFKVDNVTRDASTTTMTSGHGVPVKSDGEQYDTSGGDRQQLGDGSSHFIFHNGDEHRRSPHRSSQAQLRSSTPDGVVWWNDDGFGRGPFPFLVRGPASERREEGRLDDSGGLRDKKASTGQKGTADVAPSSPEKDGGLNEYDRRERRLGRVDRKTYLKNEDLRMLQKN